MVTIARRWLASGIFGRGAVSFLFATAGVNVSNFLFHVVISRVLGPSPYGEVGSILSVLSVLTVPLGAAQLAVTQAVMDQFETGAPSLRRVTMRAIGGGVIALAVFLALIPLFDDFLHVNTPIPLFLIALWIPLATVSAVLQGALIGEYKFRPVAFATFFGGGPIRLLLGVGLVWAGLSVDGAILATVFSQLFIAGALGWSARDQLGRTHSTPILRTKNRDMSLSIAALGCYTALIGVDTFLSRHFFSPRPAGIYAAGAVAAHIALFVPGALVTVVFPHLVDGKGVNERSRRIFIHALELTVAVGVIVALGLTLFAHLVVGILFGSSYRGAAQLIGVLSFTSAIIGVISLFVYLHLARRSLAALFPLLGLILAIVFISIHHPNLISVAYTVLITYAATMLLTALPAVRSFAISSAEEMNHHTNPFTYSSPDLDLTIVVPFYNPGPRLKSHIEEIIDVLDKSEFTYEVLAVSDGSTDQSELLLNGFDRENFSQVRLERNEGKGAALRLGLFRGRGQYLGFIDGDGDIPARVIGNILNVLREIQPDIIYGNKRHRDSQIVYPHVRRVYSWGYQQLNRVLFRLPLRDTQTGVKVIRRDVLLDVLPRMVEKRFAFDLELFVVARKRGYADFVEVPVEIQERFSSTVSIRAIRNMLLDTFAIAYRSSFLRYYTREIGNSDTKTVETVDKNEIPPSFHESPLRTESTNEKSRILILNWRDLAHPKSGGAEIYTSEIAKSWTQSGHRVTIFCAAVAGCPKEEIIDDVRIVRRGTRYSVYREARFFYEREGHGNFDLVIDEINTRPFFASKWVNDAQVVALIHQVCRELWSFQLPRPLSWFGRYWLEPQWLRSYRDVLTITLTDSNKSMLESLGLRRVVIVPEGHSYMKIAPRRRPEPVPTVLFVGRLERHKRPQDAIKAFKILQAAHRDAQLWVIGSGPMDDKLRKLASENVFFLGRVSDSEKIERMLRAHVLVVTSVREGWGLVVTEAAEVGLPSIGYDVPGLRESIRASNGVLTHPSPKALAQALLERFSTSGAASEDIKPGGVITWSEVASKILSTARSSANITTLG